VLSYVALQKTCESNSPIDSDHDAVARAQRESLKDKKKSDQAVGISPAIRVEPPVVVNKEAPPPASDANANASRPDNVAVVAAEPYQPLKYISIKRYPTLSVSDFLAAVNDSSFVIEMDAQKAMLIEDRLVKEGRHTLRLDRTNGRWNLLFFGTESRNVEAVLPLRLGRGDGVEERVVVGIYEAARPQQA